MATLYFNAAVDNDWATLGNWWTSDAFTTQASALPTSSDSIVIISATLEGSGGTVVNMTCNDATINTTVTVSGAATFNGVSGNYDNVNGNVTFNDGSANNGNVNGNVTFNDGSANNGYVGGDATFNEDTINYGTVNGSATFNGRSINQADVFGNIVIVGGPVQTGGRGPIGTGEFYFTRAQLGINGSSILGVI
jgi:hypothetical protein